MEQRIAQFRQFAAGVAPVVIRDMRAVMRGWQAPLALFLCTAAGVAAAWYLLDGAFRGGVDLTTPEGAALVGQALFRGMMVLEAGLVLVLVPLLTAGTITRERARHTLEALHLTRLTGLDIALGTLLAALGFFLLVLLVLLPIIALCALFGGVSPVELVEAQLLLVAAALALGALGVHRSAQDRYTWRAWAFTLLEALLWLVLVAPIATLAVILMFIGRHALHRPRDTRKVENRGGVLQVIKTLFASVLTFIFIWLLLGLLVTLWPLLLLNPVAAFAQLLFGEWVYATLGVDDFAVLWWLWPPLALLGLLVCARLALRCAAWAIRPPLYVTPALGLRTRLTVAAALETFRGMRRL